MHAIENLMDQCEQRVSKSVKPDVFVKNLTSILFVTPLPLFMERGTCSFFYLLEAMILALLHHFSSKLS